MLGNWINIIDAALIWLVAFYLLRSEGVKRLLPISLIAVFVIFIGEQILMYFNLIEFPMGYFQIFNTPLFHYVWAAGSGLIVIHFMTAEWGRKIFLIVVFSAIVVGFAFLASSVGNFALINGFTYFYDFIFNLIWLTLFVLLAEKIYGKRIHAERIG